jgi:outer membrane lipoprotein SlyB
MRRSKSNARTAASIGASIGASLGGKTGPVGAGIGAGFGGATGYIAGALAPDCCGCGKKVLPDGGRRPGDHESDETSIEIPVEEA